MTVFVVTSVNETLAVAREGAAAFFGVMEQTQKRRGITYTDPVERLRALDPKESERNIANKISRGSFTAAFFIMCMKMIGVYDLSLET